MVSDAGAGVKAVVYYSRVTGRAVLRPLAALKPYTTYRIVAGPGITDLRANAFATRSWSFTTGR